MLTKQGSSTAITFTGRNSEKHVCNINITNNDAQYMISLKKKNTDAQCLF